MRKPKNDLPKWEKVLNHLKRYKYINRRTAWAKFDVEDLPAIIGKIRGLGYVVDLERRKGQKNAYHLVQSTRLNDLPENVPKVKKNGKSLKSPQTGRPKLIRWAEMGYPPIPAEKLDPGSAETMELITYARNMERPVEITRLLGGGNPYKIGVEIREPKTGRIGVRPISHFFLVLKPDSMINKKPKSNE